MAGIGGVSCSMVKGNTRGPKYRTQVWQTPGFNGYGAHVEGQGDADARFVGILYDSIANVEAWINSIEALQGTLITVVDDHGYTHPTVRGGTYILVTRVDVATRQRAVGSGTIAMRGEVRVEGVVI